MYRKDSFVSFSLPVPYVRSLQADIGQMLPLEQNSNGGVSRAVGNRTVVQFSSSCFFIVTRTAAFC
jgi:hypothetical protein